MPYCTTKQRSMPLVQNFAECCAQMEGSARGKKHYRCHAHTNPFKDTQLAVPPCPEAVDWSEHFSNGTAPAFVDIGCGYGRFLLQTAALYPQTNVVGLEIRDKVVEFVKQHSDAMDNCSVIKTNALLFLPNYFCRGSLSKVFILFPDPHFKKRKQKGRVVCRQMMAVLRYLLRDDGQVYISTDVEDLFRDMCAVFEDSGIFEEQRDTDGDALFDMCYRDTDEAHRAGVKSGHTFGRIYRPVAQERPE
ncbi:tRNA (guanine-N7-)-methyltransferase [Pancytospora philotis]|nr:tRNA (guanine-N7-)-methyltransferase [Pancytospora philotis]